MYKRQEYTHECVRKHHWGYQADENLSTEALVKEEYIGIRPALGYPACPDLTIQTLNSSGNYLMEKKILVPL